MCAFSLNLDQLPKESYVIHAMILKQLSLSLFLLKNLQNISLLNGDFQFFISFVVDDETYGMNNKISITCIFSLSHIVTNIIVYNITLISVSILFTYICIYFNYLLGKICVYASNSIAFIGWVNAEFIVPYRIRKYSILAHACWHAQFAPSKEMIGRVRDRMAKSLSVRTLCILSAFDPCVNHVCERVYLLSLLYTFSAFFSVLLTVFTFQLTLKPYNNENYFVSLNLNSIFIYSNCKLNRNAHRKYAQQKPSSVVVLLCFIYFIFRFILTCKKKLHFHKFWWFFTLPCSPPAIDAQTYEHKHIV